MKHCDDHLMKENLDAQEKQALKGLKHFANMVLEDLKNVNIHCIDIIAQYFKYVHVGWSLYVDMLHFESFMESK